MKPDTLDYILGLCTLGTLAWSLWSGKQRKLMTSIAEALMGRSEQKDRAGKVFRPAEPGLVHRVGTLEQAIGVLANQETRLARLESNDSSNHGRLTALEDAAVERVATKVESIAAWQAMEAAHNSPPPE
jgi:hypothetical protein